LLARPATPAASAFSSDSESSKAPAKSHQRRSVAHRRRHAVKNVKEVTKGVKETADVIHNGLSHFEKEAEKSKNQMKKQRAKRQHENDDPVGPMNEGRDTPKTPERDQKPSSEKVQGKPSAGQARSSNDDAAKPGAVIPSTHEKPKTSPSAKDMKKSNENPPTAAINIKTNPNNASDIPTNDKALKETKSNNPSSSQCNRCDDKEKKTTRFALPNFLKRETSPSPQPSAQPEPDSGTGLEAFNQLRGSKSHTKFNGRTFNDPKGEDPNLKLFTTHDLDDNSCMLYPGKNLDEPPVGHIRYTWARSSKGPIFAVGDPYLGVHDGKAPTSAQRTRAEFGSYAPKNGKPAPYFTFSLTPKPGDKRGYTEYTWRAAPQESPEIDVQEIELREGDKKKMDGEVIAVWKMDDENGDYVYLYYKVPASYEDPEAKQRWVAALLITSQCVMRYGVGSSAAIKNP
jgi:TolA-binding protein